MDHAPTFENVHFKSMLDDYLNFQTTLLFVMTVKGTTLTMVHPHTSDQPDDFGDNGEDIVDLWSGTTEPLSRVRAGETLIFYDPVCSLSSARALPGALPAPVSQRKAVLVRWTSRRWGGLRPSLPRCC